MSNSRRSTPSSANHSSSSSSSSTITEKTCPICLTEISGEGAAILTKCKHAYCIGCIVQWSNYKRTCPLCNSSFHSYFSSSPSFRRHRLPSPPPPPGPSYSRPLAVRRVLRRTRLVPPDVMQGSADDVFFSLVTSC